MTINNGISNSIDFDLSCKMELGGYVHVHMARALFKYAGHFACSVQLSPREVGIDSGFVPLKDVVLLTWRRLERMRLTGTLIVMKCDPAGYAHLGPRSLERGKRTDWTQCMGMTHSVIHLVLMPS
jgi:hypothetical protein